MLLGSRNADWSDVQDCQRVGSVSANVEQSCKYDGQFIFHTGKLPESLNCLKYPTTNKRLQNLHYEN